MNQTMQAFLGLLLHLLHLLCTHPCSESVADLCEGDFRCRITWCRICGAVRRGSRPWELARSPRWRGRVTATRRGAAQ